jgi:hypothetical protein
MRSAVGGPASHEGLDDLRAEEGVVLGIEGDEGVVVVVATAVELHLVRAAAPGHQLLQAEVPRRLVVLDAGATDELTGRQLIGAVVPDGRRCRRVEVGAQGREAEVEGRRVQPLDGNVQVLLEGHGDGLFDLQRDVRTGSRNGGSGAARRPGLLDLAGEESEQLGDAFFRHIGTARLRHRQRRRQARGRGHHDRRQVHSQSHEPSSNAGPWTDAPERVRCPQSRGRDCPDCGASINLACSRSNASSRAR